MRTRIFKSGQSLAVRIPREFAIAGESEEVTIERHGDGLIIRPVRRKSLAGIGAVIAQFSDEYMAGGREAQPELDRKFNRR